MKIFINFDSINEKLKTISFTNDKICGININPLDFPFAEIIDLKRKFLSCGFIDSHTHFLHSALEKSYTNLNSAKNIPGISGFYNCRLLWDHVDYPFLKYTVTYSFVLKICRNSATSSGSSQLYVFNDVTLY